LFGSAFKYKKKVSQIINNKFTCNTSCLPQIKLDSWFVGFSDAESSFSIHPKYTNDGVVSKFSFMFTIELHKDDLSTLEYLQSKLKIGNVRLSKDKCIFTVSNKEGIYKLISIFDKYNLNTTKYLDYLNFKKAFILYCERDKDLKIKEAEKLVTEILELKNSMNTKRTNFNMPDTHKVVITKYWLLGFIEGDGSFFLSRTDIEPIFSIELTETQLPVLVEIKKYLENNLGFDSYSKYKLNCSSSIAIRSQKARDLGKPSVMLIIKNINILNNYFIPHLESMEFLTKKGKDFIDFKIICKAVFHGSHKIDEIKSLILKLSYTMNNFRLSTSSGSTVFLNLSEIDQIINAKPTIEHLEDGRVRDIYTNKIIPYFINSVYEIKNPNGEILIVESLNEALKILNVGFRTLKKYLDGDRLNHSVEFSGYTIKRIPVFYPNSKNK
jgi:LAGLIDADG endonuclease